MNQPDVGGLAGYYVPTPFQRFLPTKETLLSHLEDCLYLSRDHDGKISVFVSDLPLNVHFSEDNTSLHALASIFADCGLVALPMSVQLERFKLDHSSNKPSPLPYQSITTSSAPSKRLPLWVVSFLVGLDYIY
jgi:hypothetical protein